MLYIPLIILSVFALWKENSVLFMAVAGVAIMTGLATPDIMSGHYETTPLGIAAGLCLIMYGLLSCGWALKLMWGQY